MTEFSWYFFGVFLLGESLHFFLEVNFLKNLFIFGCSGSSLWRTGSLLWRAGFSSCGTQALELHGHSSCDSWA